MEAMAAAHSLVKEFLVFRGFSNTLRALEIDLSSDRGHGFQADRICDLLFITYPSRFEAENMMKLFGFLKERFFTRLDGRYVDTLNKLENSMKRHYVVQAVQKKRIDCVISFFESYGEELLESGEDWHTWFAIPYMKNAAIESRFQVYFTKDWRRTLIVSFHNFLMEAFSTIKLPGLVELLDGQSQLQKMETELTQLRAECKRLRSLLAVEQSSGVRESHSGALIESQANLPNRIELHSEDATQQPSAGAMQETAEIGGEDGGDSQALPVSYPYGASLSSAATAREQTGVVMVNDSNASLAGDSRDEGGKARFLMEPQEVAVQSVERFTGHTSPIARCRFSASGTNFASASLDGTVRIWTADGTVPASRNATIYCGSEIMSLEWEMKSDRLLFVGTSEGSIKAWNVDAKRVACDLATSPSFPRVVDIRCSPSEALFVTSTASARGKVQGVGGYGHGALNIWSMRTWKALNTLALGEDPPVVTSLCFNHNGKILATSATDGLIRLFDMVSCLPITGWPAHDNCGAACVRFSHDQSSLLSLGADGFVFEWSVHKQGEVVRSYEADRFCSSERSTILPRYEMALDSSGHSLLLSSDTPRAPLFNRRSGEVHFASQHEGPVTSVDWHPLLPVYLTASTDHTVHVTRLA